MGSKCKKQLQNKRTKGNLLFIKRLKKRVTKELIKTACERGEFSGLNQQQIVKQFKQNHNRSTKKVCSRTFYIFDDIFDGVL